MTPAAPADPRAARQGGFTLLEILVALVVLGFLMAGISRGLRTGLQFWHVQAQAGSSGADLGAVDGALRRMVEQMMPPGRDGVAGPGGSARALHMLTRLPNFAAALPSRRADVALFLDPAGNLVLRWTPRPHVLPHILPASAPARGAETGAHETILLRGVAAFDLAYLPAGPAAAWQRTWDGTAPPRLVRMHIGFPPGDPRLWPDIVASPARAP